MEAPAELTGRAPAKAREKAPADRPRAPVRVVTAPPIRSVSADSAASKAAKPARPTELSKPSRSAQQDEPDKPAQPTQPDEPDKPARTAELSKPTQQAKPAAPPCDDDRPGLRAPHRGTDPPPPRLRAPADLRALVGRRDARDALAAVAAWSRELGAPFSASSGAALVSWAAESRRLRSPDEAPRPGDLLVFDQAQSDDASDLVAIVVDRDDRGVTELIYLAGGVVRRGLVDASRPAIHRDASGATVNTYLRHGRRWPGKGMHYLAGELLGHVIRMR